jgi:hypothetical protein
MEERRVTGRTHNSPYTKIQELAEELEAISHPNVEQEHLREILRSTAIRIQGGKARSKQPARSNLQRQDKQSQWRSAFDRLGPNGSSNKGSKEDQNQSNRVERTRDNRSRPPIPSAPRNYSHQINSWQEGGAESKYKEARVPNSFPCFSNWLFQYDYLINSSRPTTLSTMTRPNLSSGSGYILNQSS